MNKAGDMEAELARLREEVATAEQTAAKDQGMLIRAAEERMSVLDKVWYGMLSGREHDQGVHPFTVSEVARQTRVHVRLLAPRAISLPLPLSLFIFFFHLT